MSITTYAGLQAAIADQIHRDDLATQIPTFIALGEALVFRELALSELIASVTATATENIALPADFSSVARLEITVGSTRKTLDYTSPNGIESLTQSTDVPSRYTLEENEIRLIPAPTSGITYTLFYHPTISALSDTNTTNWLLTNAPDLYLAASCAEACRYAEDDAGLAKYSQQTGGLIDAVRRKDERRKLSSAGALQIKPRGAV